MNVGFLIGMLALQAVLIFANAFFAATEIAVLQLSTSKLRRMVEEGDRAAPRILKLVESPSNFLSAIQIGITLAGLLGSAFAADNFADPLAGWLYESVGFVALPYSVLRTVMIILITIILSFFTLVFGELVPKQLALHRPYQVARITTPVVTAITVFLKPVIWLLSASSRTVLRIFGIRGERGEEAVTEDEIRMMVDVGHESGTIDPEEKEMIDNVFELDETIARDIMTHRVDVVAVEADMEPDEVIEVITESGKSRFPVYDDSFDDILGVLNSRTYLLNLHSEDPRPMRELLRPACFVPETVKASTLLRDMQQRKDHMAIVLDEYGGFSGIATMEDIIEELIGNVYDEFDKAEEPEVFQMAEDTWRIAGDTDIEEIEEELDIKLPEDREYDTLGGLVFSQLSSIPDDGEEVLVDVVSEPVHGKPTMTLHIHTEPVEDHHVEWAKVTLTPIVEEDEEEEEKNGKNGKNGKKRHEQIEELEQ